MPREGSTAELGTVELGLKERLLPVSACRVSQTGWVPALGLRAGRQGGRASQPVVGDAGSAQILGDEKRTWRRRSGRVRSSSRYR